MLYVQLRDGVSSVERAKENGRLSDSVGFVELSFSLFIASDLHRQRSKDQRRLIYVALGDVLVHRRTSSISRSFQVLRRIFIGLSDNHRRTGQTFVDGEYLANSAAIAYLLPRYLPFSSFMALMQSPGSRKDTNPKPFGFPSFPRTALAIANDLYC